MHGPMGDAPPPAFRSAYVNYALRTVREDVAVLTKLKSESHTKFHISRHGLDYSGHSRNVAIILTRQSLQVAGDGWPMLADTPGVPNSDAF